MNIVVTGSKGFVGRNLIAWLNRQPDCHIFQYDLGNSAAELTQSLAVADLVFHLAGVNRPQSESEFQTGNVDFTTQLCNELLGLGRPVPVVLSSSIQATLENPYGISKRQAEAVISHYAQQSGASAVIYRLQNVFGKWCRPNYNSVVATFCYNIAHDLPITISDPARELELIHVDDVVAQFLTELPHVDAAGVQMGAYYRQVAPIYRISLGQLAELIRLFCESRQSLLIPDLHDEFTRKLYGTYLTYLEPDDFAYDLQQKHDTRGSLAEFIKSPYAGQIFVSRTAPGITRGNHYHHTKTEKFLVVEGEAVVRFRHIENGQVIEYPVSGKDFRVVDIPPGYTHSIENVGAAELVTLFWASELFSPDKPDTSAMPVITAQSQE
jgi:UDP-2-acetamido-2,6-beta-L-arabino-hexul-4-ose reductase